MEQKGALRIRKTIPGYDAGERRPALDRRQLAHALRQLELIPGGEAPLFRDFADRFISEYAVANRQKPRGVKSKKSILAIHLLPRLGHLRLDELNDTHLQKLKADLSDKNPKTVNNVLTVLSKMLKVAVKWRVLHHAPVEIELFRVDPPAVAFYEFEQYDALVRHAEQIDLRILAALLLGGDAGLRAGEIAALEWDDVSLRHEYLNVRRSQSQGLVSLPKGGRSRQVPLTEKLQAALTGIRHDKGQRVLVRDSGDAVSEQTLRTWIARVEKAVGIRKSGRGGRLHILRHTFCSHLAMRGAPPIAIKELAGHTSLRTTMRYMHLSPTEARRAIQLLDGGRAPAGTGAVLPLNVLSPAGFEFALGPASGVERASNPAPAQSEGTETRRGVADAAEVWAEELALARGER